MGTVWSPGFIKEQMLQLSTSYIKGLALSTGIC